MIRYSQNFKSLIQIIDCYFNVNLDQIFWNLLIEIVLKSTSILICIFRILFEFTFKFIVIYLTFMIKLINFNSKIFTLIKQNRQSFKSHVVEKLCLKIKTGVKFSSMKLYIESLNTY